MSIKAWAVLTQEEFDTNRSEPDLDKDAPWRDYWVKLRFGNRHVTIHNSPDSALEEAKASHESWCEDEAPQLVICQVEFDDVTCANALNAVQYGDGIGPYYGVSKEYLWYPSKEQKSPLKPSEA